MNRPIEHDLIRPGFPWLFGALDPLFNHFCRIRQGGLAHAICLEMHWPVSSWVYIKVAVQLQMAYGYRHSCDDKQEYQMSQTNYCFIFLKEDEIHGNNDQKTIAEQLHCQTSALLIVALDAIALIVHCIDSTVRHAQTTSMLAAV